MFDALIQALPPEWRPAGEFLLGLIAWIPEWQRALVETVWWPGGPFQAMVATRVFVLLPALLLVVGVWSTMLSAYTLPFRAQRGEYVRTLALTWWDAGRMVWLFWVGFARLTIVLLGWAWGTLRYGVLLLIRIARELLASPFAALDWTSRRYFKPGVPWLAFLLTVLWSAIEALIFTFTLRPTLSEVFYDLTGTATHPFVITPVLFLFLFMLIAGSFASVQVLGEAIASRKVKQVVQMVVLEVIVMFFEVFFLYRELVDAAVPWIAQQTGGEVRLGLFGTLAIACCGWIGIRAMTWFLFGRFGTPALLAILARQTITIEGEAPIAAEPVRQDTGWWKPIIQDFKRERDWFQQKGRELADLAALPPLQVMAGAINFCLVVVLSQPVFSLPFRDLDEAMARLPLARERSAEPARSRGLKTATAPSEA